MKSKASPTTIEEEAQREERSRRRARRSRVDTEEWRRQEQRQREEDQIHEPAAQHLGGELRHQGHRAQEVLRDRALPEGVGERGVDVELVGEHFREQRVAEHRGDRDR